MFEFHPSGRVELMIRQMTAPRILYATYIFGDAISGGLPTRGLLEFVFFCMVVHYIFVEMQEYRALGNDGYWKFWNIVELMNLFVYLLVFAT